MKKNLLLLMASFAIVYIFSSVRIVKENTSSEELQQHIADKIVRFHVIANSDSKEDQALKLRVKDAIVKYTSELLSESEGLSETMQLMTSHRKQILKIANDTISECGYNYTAALEYENCFFPAKRYGDITFPPGYYNAFKINIGDSKGKNWWCVLYPPLCFVDAVHGILPDDSKMQLQEILGYHDYKALIYGIDDDKYNIRFEWKYLKFFN